jgi:hypothetical protein
MKEDNIPLYAIMISAKSHHDTNLKDMQCFKTNGSGNYYISVYQVRDEKTPSTFWDIEYINYIGEFQINDKNANRFVDEIRKGAEKIVSDNNKIVIE